MEEIKPLRSVTLNAERFTDENVAVELNSSLKGIVHMNSSENHSFNCCVFLLIFYFTRNDLDELSQNTSETRF